jgi:hypothetical protein
MFWLTTIRLDPASKGQALEAESALAALPTIRKVLEGVEARTIERINTAQINNVFVDEITLGKIERITI